MLNIEQIAIDAVKNTLNSDSLKAAIEKKIEKTIHEEMESQFRGYSDFGKELEKAIKDGMNVDFKQLNFTDYNHFVLATLKEKIRAHMERPTINQVEAMIEELMPSAGEQVELDALIEQFKKGQDDYDSDSCGRFNIIAERNEGYFENHIKIGFAKEFETSGGYPSYRSTETTIKDCECTFTIDRDTRKVIGFDMGHWGDTDSKKVTTWRHNFESKMFRMYAAGSIIDFGAAHDAIMELTPGESAGAEEMDIENSYSWFED